MKEEGVTPSKECEGILLSLVGMGKSPSYSKPRESRLDASCNKREKLALQSRGGTEKGIDAKELASASQMKKNTVITFLQGLFLSQWVGKTGSPSKEKERRKTKA